MAKYIAKITKSGGQDRLTIPTGLRELLAWQDVKYVTMEAQDDNSIVIRRFIDGESLKSGI